jgi:hypothetical protein
MLHRGRRLFVNGEGFAMPAGNAGAQLRALAGRRVLPSGALAPGAAELLYSWYEYGWLHPGGGL